MTIQDEQKSKNLHLQCNTSVDMIIKTALVRKSLDNVTCILIAFENFERSYNKVSSDIIDKNEEDRMDINHRHPYNYTSKNNLLDKQYLLLI
jgi:hypothetical protein